MPVSVTSDVEVDATEGRISGVEQLLDALSTAHHAAVDGHRGMPFRTLLNVARTMPIWMPVVARERKWDVGEIITFAGLLKDMRVWDEKVEDYPDSAILSLILSHLIGHLSGEVEEEEQQESERVVSEDLLKTFSSWRKPFTLDQLESRLIALGHLKEWNGRPLRQRISDSMSRIKSKGIVKWIEPGVWQRVLD